MTEFWLRVASGLVVAVLTFVFTSLFNKWKYRKKIEAAPRKYVEHLDALIQQALTEGSQGARVNARAIVSTRDDLRQSLVSISLQLNSDIDRLSQELGGAGNRGRQFSKNDRDDYEKGRFDNAPDANVLFETLQVLSRKWPSKREQIEVEIRKLLTELGLDGVDSTRR